MSDRAHLTCMGEWTSRLHAYLSDMEISLCAHGDDQVPTEIVRSWFDTDEWRDLVELARKSGA